MPSRAGVRAGMLCPNRFPNRQKGWDCPPPGPLGGPEAGAHYYYYFIIMIIIITIITLSSTLTSGRSGGREKRNDKLRFPGITEPVRVNAVRPNSP